MLSISDYRKVDRKILDILRDRLAHCMHYHGYDDAILCEKLRADANEAEYNYEVKCKF